MERQFPSAARTLSTTFVSSTQLTASGTATRAQVGSVAVKVTNPDPGSVSSNGINAEVVGTISIAANVADRFLQQTTFGPTTQLVTQATVQRPARISDAAVWFARHFVSATRAGRDQIWAPAAEIFCAGAYRAGPIAAARGVRTESDLRDRRIERSAIRRRIRIICSCWKRIPSRTTGRL